jgi:hypothetical protein
MRELIAALSVIAAVAAAPAARADEGSGLALGVRAAFGMPLGNAGDGQDLDHLTKGAIPIQIDVGWRFDSRWLAGAYFSAGPTLVASNAKGALTAAGATRVEGHAVQRVGVQALYTVLRAPRFDQWVGLGLGYEWTRYAEARVTSDSGTADAELGLRGFEAILQIGGDYRVSPKFSVGPFATVNFGQYRSHVSDVEVKSGTVPDPGSTSRAVEDRGIHEWMQLGVKGTFNL